MIPSLVELSAAVPDFALVFARICAAILFLPGLGETVVPLTVRIGLAISVTFLLIPALPPVHSGGEAGLGFVVVLISEVVTGLWFGWMVRLVANALAVAGQLIGYMIGLSSVLQPDPEIGGQSNALGTLFSLSAPLIFLITGLYSYPLRGLVGLFDLIPAGQFVPLADTTESAIRSVAATFDLAVQVASPFVIFGVIWHFVTGQIARVAARMQIYFMSLPGQILAGFALLLITVHLMIAAWQQGAMAQLQILPGIG